MSAPSYTDDNEEVPRDRGGSSTVTKIVAAVAVVAVLAFGATAISKSSSSSPSSSGAPGGQGFQPGGASGAQGIGPRGMGSAVSGATLTKLKAAVAAKYPGTIERAMQLPDGSYVVHVIQSSGTEVHVLVSKDFAITGTQQGGPPGGGAPPSGQAPNGIAPNGGSASGGAPTAPTGTTSQS